MRGKILVVDDDGDTLELLSFSLRKSGFSVATASNGVEAIKAVCSFAPDLVLLDLMMPEVDGIGVCEILKGNPLTRSIPIIMLTAMASELSRLNGLDAGANEYVTKPFSPRELVGRITEILRRQNALSKV